MLNETRAVFDQTWAKYHKKDYFGLKACGRTLISEAKISGIKLSYSTIKTWILSEKNKSYALILKRIAEHTETGKVYPKREAFTWAVLSKLGIGKYSKN